MDICNIYCSKKTTAWKPKYLLISALGSEKLAQDVLFSSSKITTDVIKTNEYADSLNSNLYDHIDLIWKRENQKDIKIDIKIQDIYSNKVMITDYSLNTFEEIYIGIFIEQNNNPYFILTNKNLILSKVIKLSGHKNIVNIDDLYNMRSWMFSLTEDQKEYYNLIYNDFCKIGHIKELNSIPPFSKQENYQEAITEVLKYMEVPFINRYNKKPVIHFI